MPNQKIGILEGNEIKNVTAQLGLQQIIKEPTQI